MSHQHYDNQWLLVHRTLTEILEEDTPAKLESLQNATPDAIFEHLSVRYLKYLDQFRQLEECYDQIVHPQKRRTIRLVLDGVLGRLVELKHEIANLENCDFFYVLNTALGMKLQPSDLEVPIPRYFVREQRDRIADYNQIITATEARRAELMKTPGSATSSATLPSPQPPSAPSAAVNVGIKSLSATPSAVGGAGGDNKSVTPQTPASSTALTTPTTSTTPGIIGPPGLSSVEQKEQTEHAVQMIQKFERVRQAKRFVRELELDKRQQRQQEKYMRGEKPSVKQRTVASIVIQKWWRRFSSKKQMERIREDEGQFLGMRGADQRAGGDAHQFMKELESARHLLQEQHEKINFLTLREQCTQEFQEALVKIKERLRLTEGPEMKAYFEDLLRQWFIEARDLTGKFPDYPTAEEGGSLNIFKLIDPDQAQEELNAAMEQIKEPKGKGGKGGDKGGKGKDAKGGKGGKDEKKGKGKDEKGGKGKDAKGKDGKKKGKEEDEGWLPLVPESPFIEQVLKGSHDFLNLWFDRDERDNPRQNYDTELIKADKREEVKEEVRLVVDEEMRQELEYLKVAIDNMKIKKKKGKKGKGKKGKKGKKNKDITANREPQSLFEELVLQNIIRRVEPGSRSLDEYVGGINFQAQRIRDSDTAEPRPGVGDVRQALSLYAALPLGAKPEVRANLPHVKGVLLGGLPSSGKRMLAEAVACQTGALFIDITPSNILGKYPGKTGMTMLMHLVFKVARLYQPAMIFIDEAEKLVAKKLPKAEKVEMKLFKKELSKTLKKWPKEERVLVFGITSSFNDCDPKGLEKIFTKIIPIYPPEYTSRYDLWSAMLSVELKRDVRSTNPKLLSLLARLSDGYTSGQICNMARSIKPLFTDNTFNVNSINVVDNGQTVTTSTTTTTFLTKDDKNIEQQVEVWLQYLLARTIPIYKEQMQSFLDWVAKIPLVKKRQFMLDVLHGLIDPKKKDKKGEKDAKGGDKKKK